MRLLLPFSFSASRNSDGGEFEELWQVEQGAEELQVDDGVTGLEVDVAVVVSIAPVD